jgi:hypothetical protein
MKTIPVENENLDLIIEQAMQDAIQHPLPKEEAEKLLITIINKVKEGAAMRGDQETVTKLNEQGDGIIQHAMEAREEILKHK